MFSLPSFCAHCSKQWWWSLWLTEPLWLLWWKLIWQPEASQMLSPDLSTPLPSGASRTAQWQSCFSCRTWLRQCTICLLAEASSCHLRRSETTATWLKICFKFVLAECFTGCSVWLQSIALVWDVSTSCRLSLQENCRRCQVFGEWVLPRRSDAARTPTWACVEWTRVICH